MTATESAQFVGDFFISFFQNPLFAAAIGAIGGVVGTLLTKFGEGRIKEHFENKKNKKEKKQKAANDVTSYCVDGMHKGFRHKPGSEHHIKLRATQIEAIDENIGIKLREFLAAWMMHRNFIKGKPVLEKSIMALEYQNKAQRLGDELLKAVRGWSK